MKIQTKEVLKDLDGNAIKNEENKDVTIGHLISQLLGSARREVADPVKFFELALKFRHKEQIELDESDYNLVVECIKKSETTPLVAGQIILALRNAKDSK